MELFIAEANMPRGLGVKVGLPNRNGSPPLPSGLGPSTESPSKVIKLQRKPERSEPPPNHHLTCILLSNSMFFTSTYNDPRADTHLWCKRFTTSNEKRKVQKTYMSREQQPKMQRLAISLISQQVKYPSFDI